MIGVRTCKKMAPKIDQTRARECSLCKAVKQPDQFKTARKCIVCVTAVTDASAEAYRAANLPIGSKMTARDILDEPWTILESKGKQLVPVKQQYVKLIDLHPDFLNGKDPVTLAAKVTNESTRTAQKMESKASIAFCPVPWLLLHIGLKQCTKCPPGDNVRALMCFNAQGTGTQLRGECRDCQSGIDSTRRTVLTDVRAQRAASGETRKCNACGGVKSLFSFSVDHPGTCTSCRNKQATARVGRRQ